MRNVRKLAQFWELHTPHETGVLYTYFGFERSQSSEFLGLHTAHETCVLYTPLKCKRLQSIELLGALLIRLASCIHL